jgi:hypothetical protein
MTCNQYYLGKANYRFQCISVSTSFLATKEVALE